MDTQWYFYLIQMGEAGPVKYGITKDWVRRMSSHCGSNPEPLNVLAKIACDSKRDARIIERNFAGATFSYATPANNEWRTADVLNTQAVCDPFDITDQCTRGHSMQTDGDVYYYERRSVDQLPMCRICMSDQGKRNNVKRKKMRKHDPLYADKTRTYGRKAGERFRTNNREVCRAKSRKWNNAYYERMRTDPAFNIERNRIRREKKAQANSSNA